LNIVLNIKIVYVFLHFRHFKNQGAKATHKKIHESNRYFIIDNYSKWRFLVTIITKPEVNNCFSIIS
jgi:hypothetical protein